MEKKKILLWLDDQRNPTNSLWHPFTHDYQEEDNEIVWVKKYQQFVDWICVNGLPDMICFDHDLENFHITKSTYKEYTGMDCAKWLVEYCVESKLPLPKYRIQSANPIGKENIDKLLKNYIKVYES
jgi:hypothetical protein